MDISAYREKFVVIFSLLLVAVTLAFYNPIIHNQFINFDDSAYIVNNPQVQQGLTWDAVKWSFTTFYQGNWHPLTWLSHALDYQVFHLNPAGHHYIGLLLHAISAVLLFLLLRRATGRIWPSLVVGALFALHPVNVESVAWAAERKNVLSTLFFLLALHAYDRYARGGGRYLFVWVNIFFALGLMAKPQIVTLPFVLLLWDYWPLQRYSGPMNVGPANGDLPTASVPRSFRFLVWEKFPLFVLAAADSVVTVVAQHAGFAIRTVVEVPVSMRLENALVSYTRYLGKAFWPSHLAPMYPRFDSPMPGWQVVGAAALLLLVTALVLRWRDRRYLPVGWFWFLGTLVPMIGIITVGEQAMADRYAYIPFIGLYVAVVWTLDATASKYRIPSAWRAVAALLVVLILGCITHRQLGRWRDAETLWRYTLTVTEHNYTAHDNLSLALARQGRHDEAIVQFQAATALHKYPPSQTLLLAYYELRVGHPQEAIEQCSAVLRESTDPKIQAAAWSELGQGHLQLRQYDQAAEGYHNSLRLNPEDSEALIGTGLLALRQGQFDFAATQLAHGMSVDPSAVYEIILSQALRRSGRTAEADAAWAQAQKISPEDFNQAQAAAAQLLSLVGVKPL